MLMMLAIKAADAQQATDADDARLHGPLTPRRGQLMLMMLAIKAADAQQAAN